MQKSDVAALEEAILDDAFTSLAVSVAMERGILERLSCGPSETSESFGGKGDVLLLSLLRRAGLVVETSDGDGAVLSSTFAELLQKRSEELRARLNFHRMAIADLMLNGDKLIYDLPQFMARAATFRYFDYARATTTKAAALEDTGKWVKYVSALTTLEAAPLANALPIAGLRTVLEIGGNSGVFARALIERIPELHVTILDLPGVCHIGTAMRDDAGISSAQLAFVAGDARQRDWPKPLGRAADAVLFKSVLHDWDIASARDMLRRAASYLPPGGVILICERGTMEAEGHLSFGALAANLVFAPFYRAPAEYVAILAELGLEVEDLRRVQLEMTFNIIVARVPL